MKATGKARTFSFWSLPGRDGGEKIMLPLVLKGLHFVFSLQLKVSFSLKSTRQIMNCFHSLGP